MLIKLTVDQTQFNTALDKAIRRISDEFRWWEFDRKVRKQEKEFKPTLRDMFQRQYKESKKIVENFDFDANEIVDSEPLSFWKSDWGETFQVEGEPHITRVVKKAGEEATQAYVGIEFNIKNPSAVEFINNKLFKFSFEVNKTTLANIRRELIAGLDAGESIPKLSKRVSKVFNFARGYRTDRIARTEIIGSTNFGNFEGMIQSEVVKEIKWLSALDSRVRDSHKHMNGEVVKLGQKFSNGLRFPGDPEGDPKEIIQCRCSHAAHSFK